MTIKPEEITEVLRNGGEVHLNESMNLDAVDLIVFALWNKGITEFEGVKDENYLSIDTVLYYPVEEDMLHQVIDFTNIFGGASEINVGDKPGLVWRAWWD